MRNKRGSIHAKRFGCRNLTGKTAGWTIPGELGLTCEQERQDAQNHCQC